MFFLNYDQAKITFRQIQNSISNINWLKFNILISNTWNYLTINQEFLLFNSIA